MGFAEDQESPWQLITFQQVLTKLSFIFIILLLNCAPTVYSPHAQNEMISVHRPQELAHDIGGAYAYNTWLIDQNEDTSYIKTYPTSSMSFYHCAYVPYGRFSGLGGVELICLSSQWEDPDESGFFVWLKPFAGWQYVSSYFTGRLNLSPFSLVAGYGDGEWGIGPGPTKNTIYQMSLLLHNDVLSKHTLLAGLRMSSGATGFVVGGDYQLSEKLHLRAEYSYLKKPLISLFIIDEELESIAGSVHYITFGLFGRLK